MIAAIGLGAARAADEAAKPLAGPENNKAPGAPGYHHIGDDDKQCAQACEHAPRELGFFMAALRAKKPGDSSFAIKKGFVEGDHVEHLWIRDVSYDGKNFHGKIDNQPVEVKNVRQGQRMTVAPREVSDWMFVQNGKLIGGYMTRVLYARLSPEEKAEFDRQAGFRIK